MVVEMALSTQPPTTLPISTPVFADRLLFFSPAHMILYCSTTIFFLPSCRCKYPFQSHFLTLFSTILQLCLSFPPFLPLSSNLPFHTVFYPICEHIELLLRAMVWQESGRTSKRESKLAHTVHTALIDRKDRKAQLWTISQFITSFCCFFLQAVWNSPRRPVDRAHHSRHVTSSDTKWDAA